MKFSVDRDLLLTALTKARAIIERTNTIPILSNVRIIAEAGRIAIRGSDLDNQIDTVITADVERPGGTTVPCGLAYDVVKSIPKRAAISIELNDQTMVVQIRSGRAKISLNALPIEDYPDLAVGDFSHKFKMPKSDLLDLIEKTQYAISSEETRYYLNGAFLHSTGHEIRVCATDGHRLALACRPVPDGALGFPGVIVPTKAISSIVALSALATEVEVSVSQAKVRVDFGDAVLLSKVIDGTFPDYERVIPRGNERKLRVDRDALLSAITRCVAVVSERGSPIRLEISQDGLTLSTKSSERGDAREEIEADFDSDADLTIGFNAKYLVSIAERFDDGDQIIMAFNDPGSPALVYSREDAPDRTVLMPMRT